MSKHVESIFESIPYAKELVRYWRDVARVYIAPEENFDTIALLEKYVNIIDQGRTMT